MVLGGLGAEVIKIESPVLGDQTRQWMPPAVGEQSTYFLTVNRNKRSIALDLKTPRGQEIFRHLLRNADVLIHNARSSTAVRLGIDYPTVSNTKPDLVYCEIVPYIVNDHRSDEPAYDMIIQALSGMMNATGMPGTPPVKVGPPLVDVMTALVATTSILAALRARQLSGVGAHLTVSLFETSLFGLVNLGSLWLNHRIDTQRPGNSHPSVAPYGVFETSDHRYLAVAVGSDVQFGRLRSALGDNVLSSDSWQTNRHRLADRGALEEQLAAIIRQRSLDEWLEQLEGKGVPCAPVANIGEALDYYLNTATGSIVSSTAHPTAGEFRAIDFPVHGLDSRSSPAPLLGEHSKEILEELGLDGNIDELEQTGVIKTG